MKQNEEKAMRANRAANAIGDAMLKTLTGMRPQLASQFKLDEQLITLAIAQAAVDIAADAASQATGMVDEEQFELEYRLHEVVHDAMNELLCT
jgi:regulator of sigma D